MKENIFRERNKLLEDRLLDTLYGCMKNNIVHGAWAEAWNDEDFRNFNNARNFLRRFDFNTP